MAILHVSPFTDPDWVREVLSAIVPQSDQLKLPNGSVLVSFKGTPKELSVAMGLADRTVPSPGSALITRVSSYNGRAPVDIWDWLETRQDK